MHIEVSTSTTAPVEIAAEDGGAGTVSLAMFDPTQGEGMAGLTGVFAFPASAWPALRDAIEAHLAA